MIKGIVNLIQCGSCEWFYIGQSGHILQHRLNEHVKSLTTAELIHNILAVAEHAI